MILHIKVLDFLTPYFSISNLNSFKGAIVVEPSSSSQLKFEEERDRFNDTIRETGNCILLAVFRYVTKSHVL
jgi:hypothetical protein